MGREPCGSPEVGDERGSSDPARKPWFEPVSKPGHWEREVQVGARSCGPSGLAMVFESYSSCAGKPVDE